MATQSERPRVANSRVLGLLVFTALATATFPALAQQRAADVWVIPNLHMRHLKSDKLDKFLYVHVMGDNLGEVTLTARDPGTAGVVRRSFDSPVEPMEKLSRVQVFIVELNEFFIRPVDLVVTALNAEAAPDIRQVGFISGKENVTPQASNTMHGSEFNFLPKRINKSTEIALGGVYSEKDVCCQIVVYLPKERRVLKNWTSIAGLKATPLSVDAKDLKSASPGKYTVAARMVFNNDKPCKDLDPNAKPDFVLYSRGVTVED